MGKTVVCANRRGKGQQEGLVDSSRRTLRGPADRVQGSVMSDAEPGRQISINL